MIWRIISEHGWGILLRRVFPDNFSEGAVRKGFFHDEGILASVAAIDFGHALAGEENPARGRLDVVERGMEILGVADFQIGFADNECGVFAGALKGSPKVLLVGSGFDVEIAFV